MIAFLMFMSAMFSTQGWEVGGQCPAGWEIGQCEDAYTW